MENIELYELYHNLFLGCLIACIALAAIAVFIFFALDIRGVIGFLSGRTAKKQIQKIEEESAAGGRLYRKSRRNQQYKEEKQSRNSGIPPSAMPGGDTEQIIAAGNEIESLRGATEPMEGSAPAEEEKTIYGYSVRRKTTGTFKIEREIVMIHSQEII
ncbi:MAG: hypothetical protein LUC83_08250 [Clostridiales bacterium]|nr:hypothetical protein [Clostridiales bacterium]